MNPNTRRQQIQEEIAKLQKELEGLPRNNHPSRICTGMIFVHEATRENYIASTSLNMLINLRDGVQFSAYGMFAQKQDQFEYLGMAQDLIHVGKREMIDAERFVAACLASDTVYWQNACREVIAKINAGEGY